MNDKKIESNLKEYQDEMQSIYEKIIINGGNIEPEEWFKLYKFTYILKDKETIADIREQLLIAAEQYVNGQAYE